MSSSTSSSSADERGAVRFVAWFLVLLLLTEAGFAWLLPRDPGRHEVDRRVASISTLARAPRNALISDSVSYGVLDGIELPADVLDLSSNQAISVAGNFFLVRRLFDRVDRLRSSASTPDAADHVQAVLYVVGPTALRSNLDSLRFKDSYFSSVFVRDDERVAVEESLERPDLVRAMTRFQRRARFEFPSFARRGIVTEPVVRELRSLKRSLHAEDSVPTAPTRRALELIEERSSLSTFAPSEVTAAFLPRLVALCAARGIQLVIAPPPIAPSLLDAWKRSGYWSGYLAYLEDVARGREGIHVVQSCPLTVESDAAFYDGVHLESSTKRAWGETLAGLVGGELSRDRLDLESSAQ